MCQLPTGRDIPRDANILPGKAMRKRAVSEKQQRMCRLSRRTICAKGSDRRLLGMQGRLDYERGDLGNRLHCVCSWKIRPSTIDKLHILPNRQGPGSAGTIILHSLWCRFVRAKYRSGIVRALRSGSLFDERGLVALQRMPRRQNVDCRGYELHGLFGGLGIGARRVGKMHHLRRRQVCEWERYGVQGVRRRKV